MGMIATPLPAKAQPAIAPPPSPARCQAPPSAVHTPAPGPRWNIGGLPVQPKLAIGAVDDPLEHEADRVADQVTRMTTPAPFVSSAPQQVRRKCSACEEEDKQKLQIKSASSDQHSAAEAPAIVQEVLREPGEPLDAETRAFFEPRFGYDFSGVRVHADDRASDSATSIGASAYTAGSNIAFAKRLYSPAASSGRRLLAHELAHVVQQGGQSILIQRDADSDEGVAVGKNAALQQAGGQSAGQASAGPASCAPPFGCPSNFCTPLPWLIAQSGRIDTFAEILAGIATFVSPRVVPLWNQYIWGGEASVQDLSTQFGPDFSIDAITISVTDFLVDAMKSDLQANPPAFPPGENTVQVTIDSTIGTQTAAALAAIRRPDDPHAMEFTGNSIPGNLAGGLGLNEAACRVGAIRSSQDDDRRVTGTLKVTLFPHIGTLLVDPSLSYSVVDTIDLCPGNCGAGFLTVKTTTILSRWEATGISGDVPFIVNFSAPPTAPFAVQLASMPQPTTP